MSDLVRGLHDVPFPHVSKSQGLVEATSTIIITDLHSCLPMTKGLEKTNGKFIIIKPKNSSNMLSNSICTIMLPVETIISFLGIEHENLKF